MYHRGTWDWFWVCQPKLVADCNVAFLTCWVYGLAVKPQGACWGHWGVEGKDHWCCSRGGFVSTRLFHYGGPKASFSLYNVACSCQKCDLRCSMKYSGPKVCCELVSCGLELVQNSFKLTLRPLTIFQQSGQLGEEAQILPNHYFCIYHHAGQCTSYEHFDFLPCQVQSVVCLASCGDLWESEQFLNWTFWESFSFSFCSAWLSPLEITGKARMT